jgi:hypothetical protein
MLRRTWLVTLLLASATCRADDAPASAAVAKLEQPKGGAKDDGDKKLSGMSILGNQEAPKSLVIVPWKSSEIGDARGISDSLDDSRRPWTRKSSCGSSSTTRSGKARSEVGTGSVEVLFRNRLSVTFKRIEPWTSSMQS